MLSSGSPARLPFSRDRQLFGTVAASEFTISNESNELWASFLNYRLAKYEMFMEYFATTGKVLAIAQVGGRS